MSQDYEHTQIGTGILVILGIFFVMMAGAWALVGFPVIYTVGLGIFLLIVAAFSGWMTIRIAGGKVTWRIGIGLVGGSAPVGEIEEVSAVRNPWYYGFGMHLTQHGWLYNVSGLDAVEVKLTSGRRFRLGTDEPQKLAEALTAAR